MVEYRNNITPQFVDGFHAELNKMRYLHSAVHSKKCATSPLKNISATQSYFDQVTMVLNENIYPENKIEKKSTSSNTQCG